MKTGTKKKTEILHSIEQPAKLHTTTLHRISLLIFTGSVGRRILIVVPVDTLYRTSIISSSIVLLLNPFANLSLAPLFLFSIYGPDLGVWPDCWVSAEFLRAPIPRKGSGSTTTTTTHYYRLKVVELVLFSTLQRKIIL